MTAPCPRQEGRPILGTTGRVAEPWVFAAARSAQWQAWAWTPARPEGCPLASTPPPPGGPATPRGRRAAEGQRLSPPMLTAMVTRRRAAVTIETGCSTWAPEPRWRMLYLCTSHPGGSARTVVSPRVVETWEGGAQRRAHLGAPNLGARAKVWMWSVLPGIACLTLVPQAKGITRYRPSKKEAFCEAAEPAV